MLKKIFLSLVSVLLLSCTHVAPSPLLSHWALDANSQVTQMTLKCSDGPVLTPTAAGCNIEILREKTEELINLARELIEADIKQAQGLDFYLHSSMIVLRINAFECKTLQETPVKCSQQLERYKLIERVAEQFFQTEKAYSGSGIDKARFWRVYYLHSNAGLKKRLDVFNPTDHRTLYIIQVVKDAKTRELDLTVEYRRIYRSHLSDLEMVIEILR